MICSCFMHKWDFWLYIYIYMHIYLIGKSISPFGYQVMQSWSTQAKKVSHECVLNFVCILKHSKSSHWWRWGKEFSSWIVETDKRNIWSWWKLGTNSLLTLKIIVGSSWNSESSCMTGIEIHKGLDQFGGIRWRRRDTSQREIFRDGRVTCPILSSSICFLPISDSTSKVNFVNSSKRLPFGHAQPLEVSWKKSDKTTPPQKVSHSLSSTLRTNVWFPS